MPKRKLDDLLGLKDSAVSHPAKRATNPPQNVAGQKVQTVAETTTAKAKGPKKRPGYVDVSKELSSLTYSTPQNKRLPKLPSNVTIVKRPMNHGPIASRFAGTDIPKVVFVSRKTPVISAVKRVKEFLREIEKRAMQSAGIDGVLYRTTSGKTGDRDLQRKLEEVSDKLGRDAEEVLVKASGRAREQALRIADWFRNREDEMICKVEVRTASTSVIDDIVEIGQENETVEAEDSHDEHDGGIELQENATLEIGDTTMELLENLNQNNDTEKVQTGHSQVDELQVQGEENQAAPEKRRKRKRKKAYAPDEIPEARLRWVKTVEVAISLRH